MSISKENLTVAGLVGIAGLAGILLTLPTVSADTDAVDTITITIPSSCSMTPTVSSAHTATVDSGTYEEGIGETVLKTICNDSNGFSIYAIGYTDDTYGNTVLMSSLGSTTDVATGTATSGNTSNWAMKLTAVSNDYTPTILSDTNGSFSSYHIIPSTYTKVATKDSVTDATNGSNIKTTYAVYMNPTQPAGTYEGKVKYTLVHPASEIAPVPPDPNACNTPVPNLTYMQDLNSSNKAAILADIEEDEEYFLKDARDEKSYCVAKLKDGNLWMTQNLDYDIITTQNYYTNQNTDIGWNSSTSTYDSTSWTADSATLTPGTTPTISDNDYEHQPVSYDVGNVYVDSDFIDSWVTYFQSCDMGTLDNCDNSLKPANDFSNPTSSGNQHYHVGNYYNWSAAVALNDTSVYGSYGHINDDANRSICPANWTLPKDSNNTGKGSTRYLLSQYGFNENNNMMNNGNIPYANPLYLNLAGFWDIYNDDYFAFGSYGYYWAPSADSSYFANGFAAFIDGVQREDYHFEGTVSPSYGNYRNDLQSIRCVSR